MAQFIDETFAYGEVDDAQPDASNRSKDEIKAERKRIIERLNQRQTEAVEEFWENEVEMKINREHSVWTTETATEVQTEDQPERELDMWDLASFEETVTANATVPYVDNSYDAFDYTHEVEWEYKPLEGVRAINATGSGNGNRFTLAKWSYTGDEDKDTTIRQDGNFFISDMTGVFDRCILIGTSFTCTTTDRLYTRVNGNWNGTGSLLRNELR